MSKDRLGDTKGWLAEKASANLLGDLRIGNVIEFGQRISTQDKTNNGAALSLDWSWYNSRPDKDARHAIRAYLLASLYNNQITAGEAHAEAERVKQQTKAWLFEQIGSRILSYLGDTHTRAVLYQVASKGAGSHRATATCTRCNSTAEVELEDCFNRSPVGIGVVLIDMQANLKTTDIGQNKYYAGTTALEHQKHVLQVAAANCLVVYDIVIDREGAQEPELTVEKQRRDSYGKAARIKTSPLLANCFPGCQLRHIPKPSYPSFFGTLLAQHLEADAINTVVVMGYDANTCVAETVFGNPESKMEVPARKVSDAEVVSYLDNHPSDMARYGANAGEVTKEIKRKIAGSTVQTIAYTKGLLDHEIKVITSRAILLAGDQKLRPEWGFLSER